MKVKAAPGSQEMQDALRNPLVHVIVNILLQVIDETFFRRVALFLNMYTQRTQPGFKEKLQALRAYAKKYPDEKGLFAPPKYVDELLQTLDALYQQSDKIVGYRRGAIVELFATKQVCPRYKQSECMDNQSFSDEQSPYSSAQIDVAVHARSSQQIEGYTCKVKADTIASADCTNLTALADIAEKREYRVHIGAICFDRSELIQRRIAKFPLTRSIKAYGIDNISMLRKSPFS